MFGAYGLYSHIRANRLRSVILLAGFVALLHALLFSLLMIGSALHGGTFGEIVEGAWLQFHQSWPVAMIAAAIWFVIAYFIHQWLVRRATGARGVTRANAPQLYNALENLCISRGIPMPVLQIIETPALNAYASGLREGQYVIAVTRGLIDTLAPDELEAVLAHELTHIRNRDVQLMVVAVIFAGIIAFFGDMVMRGWDFPYGWSPTPGASARPPAGRPETTSAATGEAVTAVEAERRCWRLGSLSP
jgi:heat shock protein HtpX